MCDDEEIPLEPSRGIQAGRNIVEVVKVGPQERERIVGWEDKLEEGWAGSDASIRPARGER